ncbi:MAG: NAD(P)-dependent oxidoreductase [Flammeovirgaceae bacterium]
MKVLLLGATGRTGRLVLIYLLNQGYHVHALVRNTKHIQTHSTNLVVMQGKTTDPNTLPSALNGCDAIISVLNISRTSDFPWSALRTPPTLLSDTMTALITAAPAFSIKKIILCSAWGVFETKRQLPAWFSWLIDHSNIGPAYRDHERQEKILHQSTFDYTIVRPVALTHSKKWEEIDVTNHKPTSLFISRQSVAEFIVNQLADKRYSRQSITVSKK